MEMTEKRFRRGKGIFIDYPSEAIIDGKTNERYYDGIKPNYKSSKEIVELLNELEKEKEYYKDQLILANAFINIIVKMMMNYIEKNLN